MSPPDRAGGSAARAWTARVVAAAVAMLVLRIVPAAWCGADADRWLDGDPAIVSGLAESLVAFERRDDRDREQPATDRFAGEWALVTHQMTALGLAQVCLAHPGQRARLVPWVTRAAL